MKALHLYRTYYPDPPGGLQEAIRQISLATTKQSIENRIFTLSPTPTPKEITRPEGLVLRERSWAAPASCDLGGYAAFRHFASMADWADVLHFHFPWPFADLLNIFGHKRKPAVMTYHSDIVRQRLLKRVYGPLMHRTFASMSAIVATSPAYAATSPTLTDVRYVRRLRMIPLGIGEESYPEHGDDQIFQRLSLEINAPYFLFVGVLRYYKGLHFLVEAAKKVNAQIVIAGTGPEEQSLKSQVATLGLTNVIFAGQISNAEKVELLKGCQALVLPSHVRSEAFGMVLIEAAMYGRPMVSCEVGSGTSFANSDGETGFVVPPADPDALGKAMNSLLQNKAMANRFGINARQRYENLLSGEALGKAYTALYNDVLDNA